MIGIIPVGKVLKLVGKPLIKGGTKVAKILTKGAEEGSKAAKPAAKDTGKALAKDTAESGGKKAAKGAGKDAAEGGGKSAKPAESSHGGGGPKRCNSFPGDTRVLLADGSTKPIAKVHIGDRGTNAKPDAHATQKHRVDGVIRTTTGHDFVQITLQDGQGQQKITATAHHRFWDHTTHRWTGAADLKTGDRLQTTHGTTRITTLTRYTTSHVTYNLTIRGTHTYYVVAGGTAVLVHNCGKDQGVYEFPDQHNPGKTYVGKSINLTNRIRDHLNGGRLASVNAVHITHVCGCEDDVFVAEHLRMQQLRAQGVSLSNDIASPGKAIIARRGQLMIPGAEEWFGNG